MSKSQRKPYPPNNFCPCKSGQKYKKCCQPKSIEYFIRADGQVVKEKTLDSNQREAFIKAKEDFMADYGRVPTVEEEGILRMAGGFADMKAVIEEQLIKSGASEEVVYAFRKTGILVNRENESQVTPAELHAWESAILEYRKAKQ